MLELKASPDHSDDATYYQTISSSRSAEPLSWASLPIEIIWSIACLLENEAQASSYVNRHFREAVCSTVLRYTRTFHGRHAPILLHDLARFTSLTHLSVAHINDTAIIFIKEMRALQSLKIEQSGISDAAFTQLHSLVRLNSLTLLGCPKISLSCIGKLQNIHLQALTIKGGNRLDVPRGFVNKSIALSRLSLLIIENSHISNAYRLKELLLLNKLKIIDCTGLTSFDITKFEKGRLEGSWCSNVIGTGGQHPWAVVNQEFAKNVHRVVVLKQVNHGPVVSSLYFFRYPLTPQTAT